ncbi:diamine oxidase [copper-containing]-like isoform X2 [Peromyscus maniculatus bairdii]|uniref:diamine oxidase [copper-containing]-like isoform X2 n=1 Tax=Peromyscus maniculatus bairdii TaxID=230844 RepID=UPI003FD61665
MNLVGRSLALGWMTTILVVQVSVARHSRWALNAKTQALWDLSPQELECVHNFLVNRRELELQSSKELTLAKNSVFLIEMLKPKKYEVLDFLDNRAMPPVREARVLIYFGAQEYPNVTEYAVGPVEQPMYMRKLSRKGGQELSWASRPMSKVESVLLFHTLKTATEPLQEFFFDITGFTLQDCNGGCLTFTNVAPRAMTFRKRLSWFLLQRLVNGYFLQPTGLELLVDHGSTDAQDWRVEQVWYNGKFYNSPEELAQKYADGEVAIVVLEDPLPKISPQYSTYKASAEFPMPISKGGPRVLQPSAEFQIPISKGGPRVLQPSAESQIPISKGGPRVLQSSAEFQIPISKGGPRVRQSSAEFQIPISKGGPRVLQPSAKSQIPISKGGPRVLQSSAEFQIPISKGGPRVRQSSAEFQIPISKGGPRVLQPSAKSQIPISKGGPRVLQSSAEFQIPISKGGPRVRQSSAEFQIPISKGGPRVLQPSAKSQIPISKGGPRVLQSSAEFQIPISKGGPRVRQSSAEFQIPISKGGPRVFQPSAESQIPISKGGPRVLQPSAEFQIPISKGGPRVRQSSAEFQIPISKGGPRVFQPSAESQIPISKGGPRVLQSSSEFQIPISKGGPRVLQSSAEFQIPISKGGPRVLQSSAEFQIPISKGGPRVRQSSAEFQIPISKGGPRVFQPSAESQIPISKGGPRVLQSSSEFQIPISKGGPRVLQSSAEFQIPISKGGPRVFQPSAESRIPISKGGPRVLQSSSEFQIPISKGGPRVLQPSAEFQIPISKGGPRVFQSSAESQIPISKGGPRVFQPSAEFQIPISKGGPRVLQSSAEFQIPISKGGPRVLQSSAEFQIPISKGGPRVFQSSAEFQMPISKGGPRVLQSSSEFQIPISKGGPQVLQPSAEFQIPISKGGPRVLQSSAEFQIPISKGGPRVLQPSVPPYSLKHNTVIYGDWSFFFKLHSSYGLQLFNVYFGGERIAYEIGVQEVMALYRGHAAEGRETKYVDVGWGLGGITHQLTPGIDCPDTATFLDASHYYDSDGPVLYQRALCIFEVPKGVPLRRHFNSNFRNSFSSHARLNGPMLVLRTTSTIHNHDYIWDFIFHPNGVMEGKMYASDYVHATFYTSEGLVHSTHLHSHLPGNVHSHLAHYRIDLDVAGTKNRFQTLRTRVESITSPWTRRSQQVKPILDKTQHFWERQAAFHFRQTLPKYLLFSNAGESVLGHSRSYRLQVPSVPEQMLPPGWQSSPAFTWPRYQLAVTKYQEAERFHSSLYNQNHHWAYPMVFEDFVHNNENIKDEDLVAWVTVGLSHNPQSEDGPTMATQENSAGFLLQPFDFFQGFQRYTASPTHYQCVC